MLNKRITSAGLLLISLLVFWLATPDLKASGVKMQANLGFAGHVTPERWVPLQVQFNGKVDAATLEVVKINDEGAQVSLENFSVLNMERIEIPIHIGLDIKTIRIRLRSEGLILAEQVMDMNQRRFFGHLILTLNINGSEQQAIERALLPQEPVLVVPIDVFDLPGLEWDYDGISRIVINDPGPVLTPAQTRSLQNWLICGGRMIVFSNRDLSESIIADLSDRVVEFTKSQKAVIQIGTGTITAVSAGFHQNSNHSEPLTWRQLLDLRPYAQEVRMTTSQCFPMKLIPQNRKTNLITHVMLIMVIWALIVYSLIWLKGFRWRNIVIFTVISLILISPLAKWLMLNWPRGADTHVRVISLPENGGTIVNAKIHFDESGYSNLVSPWGARVTLEDSENGSIDRDNQQFNLWCHKTLRPHYLNQSIEPKLLDLTGWFPSIPLNFSDQKPGISTNTRLFQGATPAKQGYLYDLYLFERQTWFRLTVNNKGERHWQRDHEPGWVRDDTEWFSRLLTVAPGQSWMMGRCRLSAELTLKVETFELSEAYWAMPVKEGDW
jgi:hypothetical protein